jgi:hypothetical protein
MTDNADMAKKAGRYTLPRIMKIDDLRTGSGNCATGTGDSHDCETFGYGPAGSCITGISG